MDTYIARQPIFDNSLQIQAYELLFRSNDKVGSFECVDANLASSHTIVESFQTIGVDTITGGKPAFINFTESLILEDIATLFPKDLLVIEVLETVEPTPQIVASCAKLAEMGYTIVLDDFVYRPELIPLIRISDIIKFDFLESTPSEIYKMIQVMDIDGKRLLAEKIETREMFKLAAKMGFELFQGYFFSRPVTVYSKSLVPLKISYLSLLKEMQAGDDMDFDKLSNTIRHDVALCHRLLKMVNSAYYGIRSEVTDIKRALAILGTKEIRKWVYLITLMDIKSNKPDEIIRMSMIRAFFMEQLSQFVNFSTKDNVFLTGMFSLIDVLTDKPMKTAISDMALASEICDALIEQKGKLFELLLLATNLERGEWEKTDELSAQLGIDAKFISEKYLEAVKLCNAMQI